MKIYTIDYDTRFANAVTTNDRDMSKCDFDGTVRSATWEAVSIRSPFKSKKIADFMYWDPSSIVASRKAIDVLAPLISPYVEVLPLECGWGEYYILNVTCLLDCINYEESKYIPFGDRKKENGAPVVLSFLKYSFYSQKIGDTPIFKDVSKPRFSIFVNDEFVDLVERSKLKGLKFNLAWEG